VPQRWIRPTCILLLVGAWIVDLVTPQLFVAAILLDGPIALSSLAFAPRFTRLLVGLALLEDATAGYFNGLSAGGHWDPIAIANRVIVALSFLLVGSLSVATQRAARSAGEAAARESRAVRERGLRRAVEAIRASMNVELIERATVREACAALDVERARLYVFESGLDRPVTFSAVRGSLDIGEQVERPPAAVLSFLQRVADERTIVVPSSGDALGRMLLETLGASSAIAAPLVEHETIFGVLVLQGGTAAFDAAFEEGLRYYADQAAIALAQARLFVMLSGRNEELAAVNAALSERTNVIRDIVYALSHDLRTPLAAAGMTIRQALAGAYGELPAGYRDLLDRSLQSNDELQRLAETLLLVSRYESGEQSAQRERVELAPLARSVVDELEPLWRAKPLQVAVRVESEAAVLGDPGELRRALVNLVANSIAFTPVGGSVEVSVDARDERAHVAVADTGFGVPESERPRLFERKGGSSRAGAGSGLGLYIVRRIAESHGGTVVYAPRDRGGSTFALTLPLHDVKVPA
jgi:signal transduction histidine kinase